MQMQAHIGLVYFVTEMKNEEFLAILKEKDKYEKIKENFRIENEKQVIMRLGSIENYFFHDQDLEGIVVK